MTTAVASKAKPTQKQRALAVQIEGLKFDRLLLQALSGSEGLSRLFHFDLEMLSELGDHVDPQDVVGKKVSVRLSEKGRKTRYFVGYINRFSWVGKDKHFHAYRAEMVPWLWQLTLAANCRIFPKTKSRDVVKKVFEDHGFVAGEHFKFDLIPRSPRCLSCIQHRGECFRRRYGEN